MKLIALRIPNKSSKSELSKLVQEALSQKFHLPFTEKPSIVSCKIIEQIESNGIVEHHGIFEVLPDNAGKWLISHFKNKHLRKKQIFIKEYFERSQNKELAAGDDRRRNMTESVIKNVQLSHEGMEQYKRKY